VKKIWTSLKTPVTNQGKMEYSMIAFLYNGKIGYQCKRSDCGTATQGLTIASELGDSLSSNVSVGYNVSQSAFL